MPEFSPTERELLLDAEERLVDLADSADHVHTRDKTGTASILIVKQDVKILRAVLELVRAELAKAVGKQGAVIVLENRSQP